MIIDLSVDSSAASELKRDLAELRNSGFGLKARSEIFWSKVDKTKDCWIWKGSISGNGYGIFPLLKGQIPAHRAAYMLTRGEIPKGLVLDHTCFNPICVNPNHLEAVTQRDNLQRSKDRKKIRPNDLSLDDELDEIYDIANKSETKYANKD